MSLLLLPLVLAAPVPADRRDPDPPRLTAAALAGHWRYDWNGTPGGWIAFDGERGYHAQHDPRGAYYRGHYEVRGGSVTITEWAARSDGSESGPSCYRFDLAHTAPGVLSGRSTTGTDAATVPVRLTRAGWWW